MKIKLVTDIAQLCGGETYIRAFLGPTGLRGVSAIRVCGRPFREKFEWLGSVSSSWKVHVLSLTDPKSKNRFPPTPETYFVNDMGIRPRRASDRRFDPATGFCSSNVICIPFSNRVWDYLSDITQTDEFVTLILGYELTQVESKQLARVHKDFDLELEKLVPPIVYDQDDVLADTDDGHWGERVVGISTF